MRVIDAHLHWWPRDCFEAIAHRKTYPRAERQADGYRYLYNQGRDSMFIAPLWLDLDRQLEGMAATGHDMELIYSGGPLAAHYSELPVAEAHDAAQAFNELMATAQTKFLGRLRAAAMVPLQDTQLAVDMLEHAVNDLNLIGVNVPGSIAGEPIDAVRLEPFYATAERLGAVLFVHPSDTLFCDLLRDYGGAVGALHGSVGRLFESSVAALRLVLSGIMERYPDLKVFHSHAGGVLPYMAGRLDKNARVPGLPERPSVYLKRMYTDTVSPQPESIRFAIDFYGIDRVLYGSDNACWTVTDALRIMESVALTEEEREKVFFTNAQQLFCRAIRTISRQLGAPPSESPNSK